MTIIIYILAGIGALTVLCVLGLLMLWRYCARREKQLTDDFTEE